MTTEIVWWVPTVLTLLGVFIGVWAHAKLLEVQGESAQNNARSIIFNAEREAEAILRESKLQARDEVLKSREQFEADCNDRRQELRSLEERLGQREINLDRRLSMLENKENGLEKKYADLEEDKQALENRRQDLDQAIQQQFDKIQEVSGMSEKEAKELLMKELEIALRQEADTLIGHIQAEARETAEKKSREIVTLAIERYAADQVNEVTTCTVSLPGDEMKGRIIGREGRNIRALEAETGCNLLIDETPEVVVISSFDPIRREIACATLERLISDGRIHPARIEEVVQKVKEDLDESIRLTGEEAIYELGLRSVDPELVRTLGRLKFRHSYSQNVLQHSLEMAHIMGMMAAELGLDPSIAKRIGLFHDIGKALDHTVEGNHALIGADQLKKHGEQAIIYNAVAAHHDDVECVNLYATLAKAADAITAARPGARSETTDIYLKRLKSLEEIANSFEGVEKSYAIQAGRELRVIVDPDKTDDTQSIILARNICKTIEDKLQYPGQIKVTVVRETRCVEYAR